MWWNKNNCASRRIGGFAALFSQLCKLETFHNKNLGEKMCRLQGEAVQGVPLALHMVCMVTTDGSFCSLGPEWRHPKRRWRAVGLPMAPLFSEFSSGMAWLETVPYMASRATNRTKPTRNRENPWAPLSPQHCMNPWEWGILFRDMANWLVKKCLPCQNEIISYMDDLKTEPWRAKILVPTGCCLLLTFSRTSCARCQLVLQFQAP